MGRSLPCRNKNDLPCSLEIGLVQEAAAPADEQIGALHRGAQRSRGAETRGDHIEGPRSAPWRRLVSSGSNDNTVNCGIGVAPADLLQDGGENGLVAGVLLTVVAADEIPQAAPPFDPSCRRRRRGRRRAAAAPVRGARPPAPRRPVVLGRPADHLYRVFGQVELAAKPPGIRGQTVEPFDVGPLGPLRSSLDHPRPHVEAAPDAEGDVGAEPLAVAIEEQLLPGRAEGGEQDRRSGFVDGRDYAGLLLVGEVAMCVPTTRSPGRRSPCTRAASAATPSAAPRK